MTRIGQNRIYTPYMGICGLISLLKIPYIHRIYTVYTYVCMVLANLTHDPSLLVYLLVHIPSPVAKQLDVARTTL
jgi:hypothetical protein